MRPSRQPFHFLRSFRFRLTLWFALVLAAILVAFSVWIYLRQVETLRNDAETRLGAQANQLVTYLRLLMRRDVEEGRSPETTFQQGQLPLLGEHDILLLVDPNGVVLQQIGSLSTQDLTVLVKKMPADPMQVRPVTMAIQEDGGQDGKEYAFLWSYTGERFSPVLLLGTPVDNGDQLPRLALTLGLSSLAVLLAAFGGGFWLATLAMRPVETITRTAREIEENDLSKRLNLKREDEIGLLADTFDQMLARLQAAFERQKRFTADASHELRTPLSIIQLEAGNALEHRRSTEEYVRTLRIIQSENEWMSRLVNELLTLARMDAGQATLRVETLDLSDLAVEVIERLSPLANARQVRLETGELPETLAAGDRVYLTQMLTNLVENGIKYAQGEGAVVKVDTGQMIQEGRRWNRVTIADNGPGIPAEHLTHLFDRFYQVDQARTRNEEELAESAAVGTGLGLAIVHSIVQAHAGRVEVSSREGLGTTFTVWLPAAPQA